jgi:hypothetical protein
VRLLLNQNCPKYYDSIENFIFRSSEAPMTQG